MTLRVLEFNDTGLRLSDESGVLHNSPGYALILPQTIEFGDKARAQSRVNPLNSYNQFWHKLSVESFAKPIGHYRHNADMAFSHLRYFAEHAQIEGDVLLALPGSFTRQQMAILLGLVKQSPLNAIGMVDSGLTAIIDRHDADTVLYADLELHQMVLSKLRKVGASWQRESVLLVPSVGWNNISENLMQLFTAAFIQQCRFNPQHKATSEQLLFDALPDYLYEDLGEHGDQEPDESKRVLKIQLRHNDSLHEINLPRSSVYARLNVFYKKMQQQLNSLDATGESPLFISDRLGQLPQVLAMLTENQGRRREVLLLPADAVASACLRYKDALTSDPEAIRFTSQLESKNQKTKPTHHVMEERTQATHLLRAHKALPLCEGLLVNQINAKTADETQLRIINIDVEQLTSDVVFLAQIKLENGKYTIQRGNALQINGTAAERPRELNIGDSLQFAALNQTVELIAVQDHDA